MSKLTKHQEQERMSLIFQMREEGHTMIEIAKAIGVTRQTIHNNLKRRDNLEEQVKQLRLISIPKQIELLLFEYVALGGREQ